MPFNLHSKYQPAGDQPKAIAALTRGIEEGLDRQTLLGVTGSGKTFTMANVIVNTQRPTLVIAHNKTLAAQLCAEFREFFPENAVEYFVSYYDYYQPEAYMPRTDTYIEKESQINEEIDRLRHAATQALLTRRDVIIIASVSCIYGLGSPDEYSKGVIHLTIGHAVSREDAMRQLIDLQFTRTTADLTRGSFRVRGDIMEVMPMNEEIIYRVVWGCGQIEELFTLDHVTREVKSTRHDIWIFPAKHYVTSTDSRTRAARQIEQELKMQLERFDKEGKVLEYERLSRRTKYDLEMIRNIGYCNGIENYSRHFDGRNAGEPPYTLLDYFPEDFVTMIDESHVTIPQIGGMYAGDRARKDTLVDNGFRLPSAVDNRPLKADEFWGRMNQVIYVSATPSVYEREHSQQVVEQIVRPTGLVDPETIVLPVIAMNIDQFTTWQQTMDLKDASINLAQDFPGQVQDIMKRIRECVEHGERALVTTLTKKMSEDLTTYLRDEGMKVAYLHSDIETLERITILTDLRKGVYDIVVGVNLLREGLDLPEVSLIGILDADKEGFLRSETSLIQTIGRAARHVHGKVVLYADSMTGSLGRALQETARRRAVQMAYNVEHGITPVGVTKKIGDIRAMLDGGKEKPDISKILSIEMSASPKELKAVIAAKKEEMRLAAANLLFETAALLRDEIGVLEKELAGKKETKKRKK